MIYFQNVSKEYPYKSVSLQDVNLTVKEGEFVSIVGHSGAGKTTLLKLILAEERPTAGNVFFHSVDIHNLRGPSLTDLRKRMGVVFQDFRLLPTKTAFENIAFAMEVAGKSDSDIVSDVPHVLDLVDLSERMHHFPHQLSGGERQRLSIARAIINDPEIILADEPTGNLDPVNTHEVMEILKKINDLGTTVILSTHEHGVVDGLGKRVITLDRGKIIRDDPNGKYAL